MSYQTVEKLSESSLQILCGKCIKEARIIWSQQAGMGNNHLMLVVCHEVRMVIVDEFQMRIRKSEDSPNERLQLTWESLADVDADYLEQIRAGTAETLEGCRDRLKHIEMFNRLKTSPEPQKRTTRFEALANELEEHDG